jgi:hypothetical protein
MSLKAKAGQTAFVSSIQLYELLSEEEKLMADNSWVEYAPFPYMWVENCKGRTNGLGLETEGKEHTMDEMPEWDPKKIKTVCCCGKAYDLKLTLEIVPNGLDET